MSEIVQSTSTSAEKEGRGAPSPDPVLKELTSSASGPVVEDAADVDAAHHWQEAARAAARDRGVVPGPPALRPRSRALPAWLSGVRGERITRLGLAFIMAVLLWVYVLGLDNPSRSTIYPSLPITLQGLTKGLDVRTVLGTATIEVQAPEEVLSRVHAGDFTVYVDATGLGAGTHTLDVKVQHPTSDFMQIRVDPAQVTVQLGLTGAKTVPIQVKTIGQPGLGYQVEAEQVDPRQVAITGPQEQVDRIATVVAEINLEGKNGTQTGKVKPRALDAAGREIPDLTFAPEMVQVAVAIRLLVDFKTLAVHVPLSGDPAAGYRVIDITVNPTTVIVQGAPPLLDTLSVLDTAPVALDGVTQTVTSVVTITVPDGVALAANQPKTVQVHVELEELTSRMTQSVKVRTQGLGTGLEAVVSPDRVEVRVSGPFDALQAISPTSLQATVDLTNLTPGTYVLTPSVASPIGTKPVGSTPNAVTVTITTPAPPTPVPTAQPVVIVDTPEPSPPPPATLTATPTPADTPLYTPAVTATHTPAATPTLQR